MSSSLSNWSKNLVKNSFKYTPEEVLDQKLDFMGKKWVYPYDFIHSFQKLKEKGYRQRISFIA